MLSLLVYLVVGLIVVGLLYYILTVLPLPEPVKKVATVVIIVVACLWLVAVLLGTVDGGGVALNLR